MRKWTAIGPFCCAVQPKVFKLRMAGDANKINKDLSETRIFRGTHNFSA